MSAYPHVSLNQSLLILPQVDIDAQHVAHRTRDSLGAFEVKHETREDRPTGRRIDH